MVKWGIKNTTRRGGELTRSPRFKHNNFPILRGLIDVKDQLGEKNGGEKKKSTGTLY